MKDDIFTLYAAQHPAKEQTISKKEEPAEKPEETAAKEEPAREEMENVETKEEPEEPVESEGDDGI